MTGAHPLEALLNVASPSSPRRGAHLAGREDLEAESAELFSLEATSLLQWQPMRIGRPHSMRLASGRHGAQP